MQASTGDFLGRPSSSLQHDSVSSYQAVCSGTLISFPGVVVNFSTLTILFEKHDVALLASASGPVWEYRMYSGKNSRKLRWLKAVSSFFNTNSLRDRCYHTVSFVSMKIISNKCPFIVQQVLIIFMP